MNTEPEDRVSTASVKPAWLATLTPENEKQEVHEAEPHAVEERR